MAPLSISTNLRESLPVKLSSKRLSKLGGRPRCLRVLATYSRFSTPPATKSTSARHSLASGFLIRNAATWKLRMNLFCSRPASLHPIITTPIKLQESTISIALKPVNRVLKLLRIVCERPGRSRLKMWWIVGNSQISSADTNLLTVMEPWWIYKLNSYQEKATPCQVCTKASLLSSRAETWEICTQGVSKNWRRRNDTGST